MRCGRALGKTARFVQNQDLVLRAFGADDFYTDLCCAVFYGVWDVHRADWNLPLLERLDLRPEQFGRPTPPGTCVGKIERAVADLGPELLERISRSQSGRD